MARAAAAAARTFPDDGAVAAYGADRWNAYVEGLPPSHREALRNYSIEPGPDTPTCRPCECPKVGSRLTCYFIPGGGAA